MVPDTIQALAIQALVVVMMLAVGAKLTFAQLGAVRRQPSSLGGALAVNFVAVPAVAYALCSGLGLGETVTIALLLCACAPGGPIGPLLADLAHGDLAFAVALMVILAMVSSVTTPVLIAVAILPGAGEALLATVGALMQTMLGFQLLPLLAGMALRRARPALAERVAPPLTRLSNGLLVVVVVGILAAKWRALLALDASTLFAFAVVIVVSAVLGLLAGRGCGDRGRASALCTGIRNVAMALLLSATHFPSPETDAAILSFAFFMLVMLAPVAIYWRRGEDGALA